MENEEVKEKKTITIGNGLKDAGFFSHSKKSVIVAVALKTYDVSEKERKSNMLERILLISGVNYEKCDKNIHEDIYVIECNKVKQLERIIPIMEKIYSDYKRDVTIEITDGCKEFFKQYEETN